jgi:hypothetical protein
MKILGPTLKKDYPEVEKTSRVKVLRTLNGRIFHDSTPSKALAEYVKIFLE